MRTTIEEVAGRVRERVEAIPGVTNVLYVIGVSDDRDVAFLAVTVERPSTARRLAGENVTGVHHAFGEQDIARFRRAYGNALADAAAVWQALRSTDATTAATVA